MEKLSPSALTEIDTIVAKHRNQPGPVIEMLHEVQNSLGYIPFEAMEKIAEAAGTSPAQVYGVVTFYAQFTTQPKGKHVINVCLGTACYVNGSQKLADMLAEKTPRLFKLYEAVLNGYCRDKNLERRKRTPKVFWFPVHLSLLSF